MKIKVAIFNLFNFAEHSFYWYLKDNKYTYTKTEWNDKLQWIYNQLSIMDADIVGFQEVFSVEALKMLSFNSGYQYFTVVDVPKLRDDKIYISSVVAIASKYPIKSVDQIKISPIIREDLHLESDFSFSRQPIKVKISFKNEEFSMFVYV